jgi:hypothetical protein
VSGRSISFGVRLIKPAPEELRKEAKSGCLNEALTTVQRPAVSLR